ncbi:MAG: ribbon-helix-helix domain-containing protein [Sulfolobales archaeon]
MLISVSVYDESSYKHATKTRIVSIKIDKELLDEIDRIWRRLGYSSRSNFLRDALQVYLKILSLIENSTVVTYDARIQSMDELLEKLIKRCAAYSKL